MPGSMKRAPDFVIGGAANPYLLRWWLIPRNKWCNVYLHQILRDDEDRALHDHPWWNCSIPLRSGFYEVLPMLGPEDVTLSRTARRYVGVPVFRRATAAHRLELRRDEHGRPIPAWSLFITGPSIRTWGFWCSWGWRPWNEFVAPNDKGAVGRGCD